MMAHTCGLSSKALSAVPGEWMTKVAKADRLQGRNRRVNVVMKQDRSAVRPRKERAHDDILVKEGLMDQSPCAFGR